VRKDESQPTCALSTEPFKEEWDEGIQEWVFVDAVRVTPDVAAELRLTPGVIVKVALLDESVVQRLAASPLGAPVPPGIALPKRPIDAPHQLVAKRIKS